MNELRQVLYASVFLTVCYAVNNGGPTIRGTTISNKSGVDKYCKNNPSKCPILKYKRNDTVADNNIQNNKNGSAGIAKRFRSGVIADLKRLRRETKNILKRTFIKKQKKKQSTRQRLRSKY
ncbi:uncharacterized protein LOC130625994 [Hydractinia symbiolongicarpus]|uniref:uncharacterized protein LOC130625994 n=1 Tax=Hydractinia symbiolongicarpus TaxID=13093 RepID=UPI00254F2B8D|nr:uncharacterized protein LOC130625994 [Hydractinia symbiolongicarpus]